MEMSPEKSAAAAEFSRKMGGQRARELGLGNALPEGQPPEEKKAWQQINRADELQKALQAKGVEQAQDVFAAKQRIKSDDRKDSMAA